jgi:hypothetical protein
MSKPKVAILLPSLGGFTEETMISVVSLAMYSFTRGIQVDVMNESVTGVAKCRNALVETALKSDYTHVLFIDSDMWFPMTMLEDLLGRGVDIVGVPYVGRAHPVKLLGHPLHDSDHMATSGLIEAETMPGGLMLIKTSVFRAIPGPWYFESYAYDGDSHTQFVRCIRDALGDSPPDDVITEMLLNSPKLNAWLDQAEHGKHGLTHECSEDINFVFKARRHGFRTWSDLDIAPNIHHIGKYAFGIRDLMKRLQNGGQVDS